MLALLLAYTYTCIIMLQYVHDFCLLHYFETMYVHATPSHFGFGRRGPCDATLADHSLALTQKKVWDIIVYNVQEPHVLQYTINTLRISLALASHLLPYR